MGWIRGVIAAHCLANACFALPQNTGVLPSHVQSEASIVLGQASHHRLSFVEASLRGTFDALAKDDNGLIPPDESFSSVVRRYFAKEHGWLIVGLEPPSPFHKAAEVHEASVLVEQAPALAEVLQAAYKSGTGLSFEDVVGTIACIEHLLLLESLPILQGAYALTDHQNDTDLDEEKLHEILRSFLLLYRAPGSLNLDDKVGHRRMVDRAQQDEKGWKRVTDFESDVLMESERKPPFSFNDTTEILIVIAEKYGKWQNSECLDMKATLMTMIGDMPGTVSFEDFHSEPKHSDFSFTESLDYLLQAGSLVEKGGGNASHPSNKSHVLISNYLLGRTNCIAPSKHHSVCCLNECEGLVSELEGRLRAHSVSPEALLDAVSLMPSSSSVRQDLAAPRQLPAELVNKLHEISERFDKVVPLHGAYFRRWLHDVFPNECPMPTKPETIEEEEERMSVEEWIHLHAQQESTRVPAWHPIMHEEI